MAYAKFPVMVKDGTVSARWSYRADRREMPPEENPRFVFTAHSAWCNFAKSSNSLEVRLKRPEITKVEWQDSEGKSVDKVYASTEYKLHLEIKDFEENVGIPIEVHNYKTGEKVLESIAIVSGCFADCKIILPYVNLNREKEVKLYISTKAFRAKNIESSRIIYPCPEFANMRWLNHDGEEIELCEYGDIATVSADVKNLEDGEKVLVYVYRNMSEDKTACYKKLSCIVQNGKISADVQMKEEIEYLKLLTETDKLRYVFVFEPANYKEYYSEYSSNLEINFTLVVNIYDDPKSVNQNDSYILEDIDNGKKYSSKKKVKDDMIAEDEKITLKFEKIKPGLKYRIKYLLENSSEGHIVYDNLDFIELVDK